MFERLEQLSLACDGLAAESFNAGGDFNSGRLEAEGLREQLELRIVFKDCLQTQTVASQSIARP